MAPGILANTQRIHFEKQKKEERKASVNQLLQKIQNSYRKRSTRGKQGPGSLSSERHVDLRLANTSGPNPSDRAPIPGSLPGAHHPGGTVLLSNQQYNGDTQRTVSAQHDGASASENEAHPLYRTFQYGQRAPTAEPKGQGPSQEARFDDPSSQGLREMLDKAIGPLNDTGGRPKWPTHANRMQNNSQDVSAGAFFLNVAGANSMPMTTDRQDHRMEYQEPGVVGSPIRTDLTMRKQRSLDRMELKFQKYISEKKRN